MGMNLNRNVSPNTPIGSLATQGLVANGTAANPLTQQDLNVNAEKKARRGEGKKAKRANANGRLKQAGLIPEIDQDPNIGSKVR